MDYEYTKALRKLLYAFYKLDLNDDRHCSSMATTIMRRVEKVIKIEENEKARQRILEKYGHLSAQQR
jgi:hypothetical protein